MTLEKMTARMEEISNELRKTQRELDASKQESQAKAQKQDNAAVMELTKEVDGLKNSQLATQQNYELKMQMMKDSLEKTVAENMANNATQSQVEQAGKVFEQPKNPFENRISNIAEPGKADAKSPLSRSAGAVAIRDIDEDTSEQAVKDKEKKEEKKDKAKAAEEKKKNEQRKAFLPAGSIMSGTLLTGMFAPTNGYARNDPFPVLMRVKHEALLPNKFTMDVRECFAIGSGYGDLSSERAMIRAEILSCVNDDGVAFEVPLDAYATGPDGKAGMPGKLITRNGQMIAQALMAGFISGMADSMRPRRIQGLMYSSSAYDGAGGFDTPNPESVMSTGAFKGVSTALGRVADYYIQLAEQAFPVIEINAGTKIDFIVKRGVNIRTNK
jgi:conjugal transfer pilus assembly protein TraB